jgi:hypothetical protein
VVETVVALDRGYHRVDYDAVETLRGSFSLESGPLDTLLPSTIRFVGRTSCLYRSDFSRDGVSQAGPRDASGSLPS